MARGGGVDPLVRYAVLGGLGWAGWNWASSQPAGSWARGMIDQARGFVKHPHLPGAAPAPAGGGVTQTYQVYQMHDDGFCYLDTGWSDGHVDSARADRSKCGGAPRATAPAPAGGGITQSYQVYQMHDDGFCYLDTGWSDGHVDSARADPSQCVGAGQPLRATTLVDMGGFPLVWDASRLALRQDPGQGGTNVYGAGDVVQDAATGAQWSISDTDGGTLLSGPGGAVVTVVNFLA